MRARGSAVDRRSALRLGSLAAMAVVGVPLGAACGSDSDAAPSGAKPRLETLKIGAPDAINSKGLDPRSTSIGASLIVLRHLYDSLMVLENGEYRYQLAEAVEPNGDGSRWTIRLRQGALFHNGAPVTAEDVLYSMRTIGSPPSNRVSVYSVVDLANCRAVDQRTVEVPLKAPRGDFRESVLVVFSPVFPKGTQDFKQPIGSGPYRIASNTDSVVQLVVNDGYWGPAPAVRELQITRILDAGARLNALKAGQIDYAVSISSTGAKAEAANPDIAIQRGGSANSNALSFAMNERLAPFNDPRVRRAVRLAIDRKALVDNAFLGLGSPADDVVGKDLPGYADLPARTRDVEAARRLFAEAGVANLKLRTGEVVPGMLNASRLLVQQLAEAGVKVELAEVPADSYYADLAGLAKNPFQAFYYVNRPAAVHLAAVTNGKAPFNVIGTSDAYQQRLAAAQALVADADRAKAFAALQHELYDSGGDVLWGFQEQLDASRRGITGVRVAQSVQMFDSASTT